MVYFLLQMFFFLNFYRMVRSFLFWVRSDFCLAGKVCFPHPTSKITILVIRQSFFGSPHQQGHVFFGSPPGRQCVFALKDPPFCGLTDQAPLWLDQRLVEAVLGGFACRKDGSLP